MCSMCGSVLSEQDSTTFMSSCVKVLNAMWDQTVWSMPRIKTKKSQQNHGFIQHKEMLHYTSIESIC